MTHEKGVVAGRPKRQRNAGFDRMEEIDIAKGKAIALRKDGKL